MGAARGHAVAMDSDTGSTNHRATGRQDWEGVLTVRHHPILLLTRAWLPGLLMLLGAVAVIILATAPRPDRLIFTPVLWLAALTFLGGALWAVREYLLWAADLLALTEHRLIAISGIPLLSERRRELRFERIETVELDQRNPVMRWCGCADLIVGVAGGPPLRFIAAREPIAVRDHLAARLREREQLRSADADAAIRASVERTIRADDTPLLPAAQRPVRTRRRRSPGRGLPLLYFGKRIEGEVWQRHRWFLLGAWCAPALLLICSGALPFALDWLGLGLFQGAVGFVTLGGIVVALLWGAWGWGNWRNDYYVVTNERLIAIDQLPLGLRQQITEAALDKVQDIGYRLPHPWAILLDYGDVTVHTASESQPFVIRGIARPRQLADRIDRHVAARKLAEQHARHDAMRTEFARWLTAYDEVLRTED